MRILYISVTFCSYFLLNESHLLKSDNLQYNTVGQWDGGIIVQPSDGPLFIWFLGKNLSNFVFPAWKLDNRYYHNVAIWNKILLMQIYFIFFHSCPFQLSLAKQSKWPSNKSFLIRRPKSVNSGRKTFKFFLFLLQNLLFSYFSPKIGLRYLMIRLIFTSSSIFVVFKI